MRSNYAFADSRGRLSLQIKCKLPYENQPLRFVFFSVEYVVKPLGHNDHDKGEDRHIKGIEPKPQVIAEEAEEGRHNGNARVGTGHLNANDGLRVFSAEVIGRGMDDAGVDGRASKTDDEKTRKGGPVGGEGDHNENKTCGKNDKTRADKRLVVKFRGEEAVEKSAEGDADVKQRSKSGGGLGIDTSEFHEIAGCPKTCGGFQSTIGEKGDEHVGDAADLQRADKPERLGGRFPLRVTLRGNLAPKGKAEKQAGGERQLNDGNASVAHLPAVLGRQTIGHDVGADRGTKTPEAMEPAHMPRGKMERHVVVERRVDGACAKSVGNGKQAEHENRIGEGKAHQGQGGEGTACGIDDARAELSHQAVGQKAGYDGARRDDQADNARGREACAELHLHHRPCRAKQRVGQAEADKGNINNCKQQ